MGHTWLVLLGALSATLGCPWLVAWMGVRALVMQVVLTSALTAGIGGVALTCACLHLAGLWHTAGLHVGARS